MRQAALLISILLAGCATQGDIAVSEKPNPNEKPNSIEKHLESGYAELSRRNFKSAIQDFEEAISLCEGLYTNSETRYYASRTMVETMYYMVQAAAEDTNAAAVGTLCSDALFLRGYTAIDLGDLDSAQLFMERATDMSPMNSMYLSELGHIHQSKRDWQKALEIYELSARAAETYSPEEVKNTELARAKRGIGYVLIELGRLDEAEVQFRECLEIDANDAGALGELEYIENLRKASNAPPGSTGESGEGAVDFP